MRPIRWLGAPAPGGLALPSARPTASELYAPRGVWCDDRCTIVADSGNHRVLIWWGDAGDHGPADVVLGQPGFGTEGPRAGGRGPAAGLHLPTGLAVADGCLVVADAWHHRLLVWDGIPERVDAPPARAIGQATLEDVEPNRGRPGPHATGLYWPYGVAWIGGGLVVADTGNRRVLAWRGLPDADRAPDRVLGQPTPDTGDENAGGPASARSFRWPHGIAHAGDVLYVADAGNHRVLGWRPWPAVAHDAQLVLGQPDFARTLELPHRPQGPAALRFPYAVATQEETLAVADTANNRVLLWNEAPRVGQGLPADGVIGQADFAGSGENRWQAVTAETLCWPYGLWLHDDRIAIADSGNNRVMVWSRERAAAAVASDR